MRQEELVDAAIFASHMNRWVAVFVLLFVVLLVALLRWRPRKGRVITSRASGNWSDPATWSGGIAPGDGDEVVIHHEITIGRKTDEG